MIKYKNWFIVATALSFNVIGSPFARAADDCEPVLKQTVEYALKHSEYRSAVYSLVTRENYESLKTAAGANYANVFSANYDSLSQQHSSELREHLSTEKKDQYEQTLKMFLPQNISDAWLRA